MITTLSGNNSFALHESLQKITNDFIKKHGDFAVDKIDAEDVEFDRVKEALQAPPFLAPVRLVVLKNPSSQKAFTEDFEKLIKQIPEGTDLVIYEPKLDKRSVYFKSLQKTTDFKDFKELDQAGLQAWAKNYAEELRGSISSADLAYLIGQLGPNQQLIASELQKLVLYSSEITRENIDLLVDPTPQSTVFEMLDAALNGQTKKAIRLYADQRTQKVEPIAIMAMIAWQLHVLASVKASGNKAPLNPYVVRKNLPIAKKLSLKQLKELVKTALELDIKLKSQSIDADEAIKNYLLKLSN